MAGVSGLETFTRIGFAARGVLYMVIGYLALRSGGAADNIDALEYLQGHWGKILLGIMAIGFLAYGVWRLSEAYFDTEGHGTDGKGIAVRIGGAVSGIIHLGLTYYAVRLSLGEKSGSGESASDGGASTALALPGGEILLGIAAAGIIATGLYQLVKAVKLDFLKHLDSTVAHEPWVAWAGRIGYAARGVVFAILGWLLWRAAQHASAPNSAGTEEAMLSLPTGIRAAVAVGFVLFGVFSLIEARYRRINDPHVLSRLSRAGG